MNRIMVIAPHPDDETLGCGGTLLRHAAEGDTIHWLIVTAMDEAQGFSSEAIAKRREQIARVHKAVGFNSRDELNLPTTQLDTLPLSTIVSAIGDVITRVSPDTLYLPYPGDIHSDHSVVFKAAASCSKWFRYPSIKRIYCYETLSETDFSLTAEGRGMPTQRYVDISQYLDDKIETLKLYEGEMGEFPFPRSVETITALAKLRGAASGCQAAEAFQVLKEIV